MTKVQPKTTSANDDRVRVSVLMPAYNEAATIAEVLRRVLAVPLLDEIVVVDDGSTDGTSEAVRSVDDPRVRLFIQLENAGKTAAIQRAVAEARGEVLVVQDADLEYDPDELPEVLGPILDGKADVVYGSRFLVRRAARVLYFYHYVANKTLTALSNILTNHNMTDIETCYKAARAPIWKHMRFASKGFGMEVELTALITKLPLRIFEVPISYYGRTYAEGKKIGMSDGVMALLYIGWFNLVTPFTDRGRAYLDAVADDLSIPRRKRAVIRRGLALIATLPCRLWRLVTGPFRKR